MKTSLRSEVTRKIEADYPSLDAFYKDLHAHPELSLMEEKTSAKLAAGLRAAGPYAVTENVGGYGIVAVLENGAGPTVLLRADLDALPVEETTGLPYASKVRATNLAGQEVPVMHACGHDVHTSVMLGTARTLSAFRDRWSGTLVLVGQPAEEIVVGAGRMLDAGLYRKFPKPDCAIALHDRANLPAGDFGLVEGFVLGNVDTVQITVRGIGGHGAYPHTTKDPVVLAARLIMDFQTIVSRETSPLDAAVVTVGAIHGGTRPNIIPGEVKMDLTVRSFTDEVRARTLEAIRRICRGAGIAAGLPEELMPIVTHVEQESTPATYNDPALTRHVGAALANWFGADRVKKIGPETGAEDFGRFGRTPERVPICLFWLGAVDPKKFAESERTGAALPPLHSSYFAPVPEPTLKTGVAAMTAVVLRLMAELPAPAGGN